MSAIGFLSSTLNDFCKVCLNFEESTYGSLSPKVFTIAFLTVLYISLSFSIFNFFLKLGFSSSFSFLDLSSVFVLSSEVSLAATLFCSVISCVNCSPKTLLEASIALAGRYLFIKAANGTPDSGLYSDIRSSIPRFPVSISSVNNCLSKLGASLRFSTILFTIGLN